MGQNESSARGVTPKVSKGSTKVHFSGAVRQDNLFSNSPYVSSSVDDVPAMVDHGEEMSVDQNLSNLPLPPMEKSSLVSHPEPRLNMTVSDELDCHSAATANITESSLPNPINIVELPDIETTTSMKAFEVGTEHSLTTPPTVMKDIRTVPRQTNDSGRPFLSVKLTADLIEYENKADTKNTRNSNKDAKMGPFQNLALKCKSENLKSDKVKNKLEEMYSSKNLSPGDLDKSALDSLYNLPEDDALHILHTFSECDLKAIKNKSAYICSIIKSRTSESNFRKLGNKTPPPYFDSTPLVPFFTERKSPTQNITFFKNTENLNNPASNSNNWQPSNKNASNQFSPPFVKNNESSSVNKENSQINFSPHNPTDYGKPFQNSRKPLPAAKFGAKQKTNLSKMAGNRSMKLNTHSSKSFINKHAELEKIANQLTTCIGDDVRPSTSVFKKDLMEVDPDCSKLINSSNISYKQQLTLEECIHELENLDVNNEGVIRSLQPELIHNLQKINSFLNLLKGNLVINENVSCELNKLNCEISALTNTSEKIEVEELSFLSSNIDCKKYVLDPICNSKENIFGVMNNEAFNIIDDIPYAKDSSCITSEKGIAEAKLADNDKGIQGNIPLKPFMSLLDDLSPKFQSQKKYISLLDDKLFCQMCNKSITLNLSNLEEHLLGKIHNQMLSKVSETPIDYGKNHLNFLEVALETYKNNLKLPSFYICIPCDQLINNEDEAKIHVEKTHHEQNHIGDIIWRYCEACPVQIYGTSEHFQQHSLATQHSEIMKLKGIAREPSESDSVTDGGDRSSVLATQSDRNRSELGVGLKTPHEILLAIAKNRNARNTDNGAKVGLYCDICRRYYLHPTNINHLTSNAHKNALSKLKKSRNVRSYSCLTCNVDIFGTKVAIMVEHRDIDIHKELVEEKTNLFITNAQKNGPDSSELSDNNSPHFKLMSKVFKKHISKESKDKAFFGFYCHPCLAYSEDEKQWTFHQSTPSHIHRLNSFECIGKATLRECLVCNVQMISDDNAFNEHNNTQTHHELLKLRQHTPVQEIASMGMKSDEELSDGTDEDLDCEKESEDEYSDESDDDESTPQVSNQKPTQQDQADSTKPVRPNGVYITGLPPYISHKEVYENFKNFGYIQRSTLLSKKNSCRMIFKDKQDAAQLLKIRTLTVKNSKVTIRPLIDNRFVPKKTPDEELDTKVTSALASRAELRNCMDQLLKEVATQALVFMQKSNQISQDICQIFQQCKVHFFGSQVTGLALDNSDFDIYIDFDNRSFFKELPQKQQECYIKMLLAEFTKPGSKFLVKASVLTARVPIVRTLHLGTNTLCDISCCSGLSVENSQLVKTFVAFDPRVRWLVLFVKWWMKTNQLLDRTVFTSYACSWLVFFFLMQLPKPVLCSVAHLQQGCPDKYSIANWDCRFLRGIHKVFKMMNKQSEFDLLTLFFKYYETFNFRTIVVSPLTGMCIPRHNFIQKQLPPEYTPYVIKITKNPNAELLRLGTPICIQDPFDLSHNVTKGVANVDLKRFQALCGKSAKLCASLAEA